MVDNKYLPRENDTPLTWPLLQRYYTLARERDISIAEAHKEIKPKGEKGGPMGKQRFSNIARDYKWKQRVDDAIARENNDKIEVSLETPLDTRKEAIKFLNISGRVIDGILAATNNKSIEELIVAYC